ncbi:MAG TPA: glycosyltransferase [Gemmataceae bacterium]|nr:glycosyltransferase [Gemmataceae bacterium]
MQPVAVDRGLAPAQEGANEQRDDAGVRAVGALPGPEDVTGRLFRSPAEFEERLRELIGDRDLRRRLAANAYAWVREQRLLSQHYRSRYNWYFQMRERLPRLNEERRRRLLEQIDQLRGA